MSIETMSGAPVELSTAPAAAGQPATRDDAQPTSPSQGRRSDRSRIPTERQTALARAIIGTLATVLPAGSPLTFGLEAEPRPPDGEPAGANHEPPGERPAEPEAAAGSAAPRRAHVRVHGPGGLARMLPPTGNAFAEAFLRGDIDIEGDIAAAVEAARDVDLRRLSARQVRRLVRWSLELRGARGDDPGTELRRPAARLAGARHSRARDLEAVRFHYDVGESFFRLWLDRRLTYSCAYFAGDDDPVRDLDAAQEAKLDLVCRKLDLRPGQRLLDIGCGWGSLILYAAERYKVDAVGVTLSQRQADEANRRAALLGLERRVRAEVRDYRDLAALGPFDAVASIGMFEHVGAGNLPAYFAAAFGALSPGGRFLNHGIATAERRSAAWPRSASWRGGLRRATFTERYVFPDGELVPVEAAVRVARDGAGFEVLDLASLRPHYALTLQAWVARLESSWDEAVAAAGAEVARTWRLYMAGARVGFERGDLDVAQLLLARPVDAARPAPRPLRPWW